MDNANPLLKFDVLADAERVRAILRHAPHRAREERDDFGATPLHIACDNGLEDSIRVLLDAGADIDTKDDAGQTPLHIACWTLHEAIMKDLVGAGATLNCVDEVDETPLLLALTPLGKNTVEDWGRAGRIAIHLIEAGADVRCRNMVGETVLNRAVMHGLLPVMEAIDAVSPGAVKQADTLDARLVWGAVMSRSPDVIDWLVTRGMNVHGTNKRRRNALHLAAQMGMVDIVDHLVGLGLDPAQADEYGATPYMLALDREQAGVVAHLEAYERRQTAEQGLGRAPESETSLTL